MKRRGRQREEEEPQERGDGGQQGGHELDRWNISDNYAVFGLASVVTLLLMALSSTPLHASDTHVRNWLSIFVAFDESVIVRCGRPSERKGGSGARAGTTIMRCGTSRRGRSYLRQVRGYRLAGLVRC